MGSLLLPTPASAARRPGTTATVVLHGSPRKPQALSAVTAAFAPVEAFCTPIRCTLPVTPEELTRLESAARAEGLGIERLARARLVIWPRATYDADTATFTPSLPAEPASAASPSTPLPWVVLFKDYPRVEWRRTLSDLGLHVAEPVPLLGTIVYGPASAAAEADRLDFVDSVFALHPAVKRHGAEATDRATEDLPATIAVFDTGEPLPASVAAQAAANSIPGPEADGVVEYHVRLTADEAVALSREPRVVRVMRDVGRAEPSDERSNRIVGGDWPTGQPTPTAGSAWPSSLSTNTDPYAWDRYLANLAAKWPGQDGFDLSDQVIGLVDTGVGPGFPKCPEYPDCPAYPDCPGHLTSTECNFVFAADTTVDGEEEYPDKTAIDYLSHGTHVSALAAGYVHAGRDPNGYAFTQGMAPGAKVAVSKMFSARNEYRTDLPLMDDLDTRLRYSIVELGQTITMSDQTIPSPNVRLFNHSWNNRPDDPPFLQPYENISRTLDRATRDRASIGFGAKPNLTYGAPGSSLHVVSAGNQPSGQNQPIEPPANAKNVISVGATLTYNPSPYPPYLYSPGGHAESWYCDAYNHTDDPRKVADVSANGLLFRFKPDLMAPGTRSYGELSPAGCDACNCAIADLPLVWDPGTSFAAPLVTGAAALVREWRQTQQPSHYYPSPALTKAILISAARDLGDGPDGNHAPLIHSGWGGLSLEPLFGPESGYFFQEEGEQFVPPGWPMWWQRLLEVEDPSKPVVVTLVWTDAASPAGTDANLVLRNDLDLLVANPEWQWYGNDYVGGFTVPRTTPPSTRDHTNNVERVTIAPGLSGTFTVYVSPYAIVANMLTHGSNDPRQDFALAVINAHEAPAP